MITLMRAILVGCQPDWCCSEGWEKRTWRLQVQKPLSRSFARKKERNEVVAKGRSSVEVCFLF